MPATFLEVFVSGDLLRDATKHHLNHHPRSVAALVSSCTALCSVQKIPVFMETLIQSDLKFWPLFLESHYALCGLSLEMADVGDDRLVSIVKSASLHTLRLTCSSAADLARLGQCASLHTLGLETCYGVTDVAGLALCVSLHTLKHFDCIGVADVAGLRQCASLHTLNLSGCHGVTDVAGLGQCASLHTLDLSGCHGVTHVTGLGQCASLHTLRLVCRSTLADVAALGQCASLHTLDLHDCHGVTDVVGLGQCVSLHTVYLADCSHTVQWSRRSMW